MIKFYYRLIVLALLLTSCSSPKIENHTIYQNITFYDFMKKEGYHKNSRNIYVSNKWYKWDFGNDKGTMVKANDYCIYNGGKPMNYSHSFNKDTKNDVIPKIVEKYIDSLPDNNMDYSYTACTKGDKTLFSAITEYRKDKMNKTLKRYLFIKSNEIDKNLIEKKHKQLLSQLKNRFGNYDDVYFTQCQLGKMDFGNKNKIIELFSDRKIICSSTCAKVNEKHNGYLTLQDALDNGWKIIEKTNNYHAKEVKRNDGTICSCFGYKYKMFR